LPPVTYKLRIVLSLVLPTFNEAANIRSLVESIDGVLQSMPHEIIIVDDDSPDETWKVAMSLALHLPAVRVIRREGKRGLSSAVIDGFNVARGTVLAVMDADGQHDPILLLKMLKLIEADADLVIGSRYIEGGSIGDWVGDRRILSRAGTLLARNLSRAPVTDPLAGFFMLKADLFREIRHSLKPAGFKILLEILSHLPASARISEVPLVFRMRLHGRSKLSFKVNMEFLGQVLRLSFRRLLSLGPLVFFAACLAVVLILAPKAWVLRRIYYDLKYRNNVESAILTAAKREGWLVSDIELKSLSDTEVSFIHREHLRYSDGAEACLLSIEKKSLICAGL